MKPYPVTDGGLSVYGESAVIKALQEKRVDLVLISEDMNKFRLHFKCPSCGKSIDTESEKDEFRCPDCGTSMLLESKEDLVGTLYTLAEDSGARVSLISEGSEEGLLLKKAFGGIAGVLRYATESARNYA